MRESEVAQSLSHVQLLVTPWTAPTRLLYLPRGKYSVLAILFFSFFFFFFCSFSGSYSYLECLRVCGFSTSQIQVYYYEKNSLPIWSLYFFFCELSSLIVALNNSQTLRWSIGRQILYCVSYGRVTIEHRGFINRKVSNRCERQVIYPISKFNKFGVFIIFVNLCYWYSL